MDTRKIEKFMNSFGLHILLVIAGLVLLVNPDGAAALVTKLIGWILVIGCALHLIGLATGNRLHWGIGAFVTGAILCFGVVLLVRPMLLADGIGRIFGLLLLMEGFDSFRKTRLSFLTILTIVAGAALTVMPRTLTHTVLAVCGIVMIIIGIVNILGKANEMKRLKEPSDPNIIDADM